MGGQWWHCFIPLKQSAIIIGTVDVVLGTLTTALFALYIHLYANGAIPKRDIDDRNYYRWSHQNLRFGHENVETEIGSSYHLTLVVVVLIVSVVQVIMGFTLFYGAMKKSKKICMIWIVSNVITLAFMWCFLIRVYGLICVYMFYRELEDEQRVGYCAGGPGSTQIPPQTTMNDQPPSYRYYPQGGGDSTGTVNYDIENNGRAAGYPKVGIPERQYRSASAKTTTDQSKSGVVDGNKNRSASAAPYLHNYAPEEQHQPTAGGTVAPSQYMASYM